MTRADGPYTATTSISIMHTSISFIASVRVDGDIFGGFGGKSVISSEVMAELSDGDGENQHIFPFLSWWFFFW